MTETLKFSIEGHFKITDLNSGLTLISKKNLVVNTAKTILTNALVGHPSGDYIAFMAFGGGSTPPVIGDRTLSNQTYQAPCGYDSQPSPYFQDQEETDGTTTQSASVVFSAVISAGSNNYSISEAGLFSARQFMFSRIVFPVITKPADSSWLAQWTLKMRIA